MTSSQLTKLKAKARADADADRYFAVRRLLSLPAREPVLVGIVGPYDLEGFPECAFFADAQWAGQRMFIPSLGDRFSAIGSAVQHSRVHLVYLLNLYPEGLLGPDGSYYQHGDLPEAPVTPPPLDFSKIRLYKPDRQ